MNFYLITEFSEYFGEYSYMKFLFGSTVLLLTLEIIKVICDELF